jgi:hypothetical protein
MLAGVVLGAGTAVAFGQVSGRNFAYSTSGSQALYPAGSEVMVQNRTAESLPETNPLRNSSPFFQSIELLAEKLTAFGLEDPSTSSTAAWS